MPEFTECAKHSSHPWSKSDPFEREVKIGPGLFNEWWSQRKWNTINIEINKLLLTGRWCTPRAGVSSWADPVPWRCWKTTLWKRPRQIRWFAFHTLTTWFSPRGRSLDKTKILSWITFWRAKPWGFQTGRGSQSKLPLPCVPHQTRAIHRKWCNPVWFPSRQVFGAV